MTLTDIFSETAVHVEGIVAELRVGVGCVEQESVRAELLLRDLGHALVVLVALLRVGKEPVLLRTTEGRAGRVWNKKK